MIAGFLTFVRGFLMLIRRPSLWPVSFLPIFLTALLWAAVVWLGVWSWNGWVEPLIETGGNERWARFEPVLFAGALLLLLAVAFFLFSVVGGLMVIPFMESIAKRAEAVVRETRGDVREIPGSAKDRPLSRALLDVLRLLVYKVLILMLLLPVLLIPVFGPIIFLLVGGYLNGVDLMDVALSCKDFTWEEKRAAWRANRPQVCGLGLGLSLGLMIPFLSLLVLPAGAIAATLMTLDPDFQFPDDTAPSQESPPTDP